VLTLRERLDQGDWESNEHEEHKMRINRVLQFATICLAAVLAYPAMADDASGKQAPVVSAAQEQVNINVADAETLRRVLVGIGRSRAEAIVAYREANGKFYSAEELTAVKGIGASIVRRNKDRIRVE